VYKTISHPKSGRAFALLLVSILLAGCSLWVPANGKGATPSPVSTIESSPSATELPQTQPAHSITSGEERKSFAIHLVSGMSNPQELNHADLNSVELQSPPLIQDGDIVHYELETHEIELSEDAFERIMDLFELPVDVDGIPFVVAVSGEPVYSGAFYTPASSLSYSGVVILQPLGGKPRTITLALGYPSVEAFEGQDPRSDPRIVQVLKGLGFIQN